MINEEEEENDDDDEMEEEDNDIWNSFWKKTELDWNVFLPSHQNSNCFHIWWVFLLGLD